MFDQELIFLRRLTSRADVVVGLITARLDKVFASLRNMIEGSGGGKATRCLGSRGTIGSRLIDHLIVV